MNPTEQTPENKTAESEEMKGMKAYGAAVREEAYNTRISNNPSTTFFANPANPNNTPIEKMTQNEAISYFLNA